MVFLNKLYVTENNALRNEDFLFNKVFFIFSRYLQV
jgi:hypothetical protein